LCTGTFVTASPTFRVGLLSSTSPLTVASTVIFIFMLSVINAVWPARIVVLGEASWTFVPMTVERRDAMEENWREERVTVGR